MSSALNLLLGGKFIWEGKQHLPIVSFRGVLEKEENDTYRCGDVAVV
jgi:hypothetical protein